MSETVLEKLRGLEASVAKLERLVGVPPGCRMLTAGQVAAALGVSVRSVSRLVAEGAFPAGRLIGPQTRRWPARTVERWIEGGYRERNRR